MFSTFPVVYRVGIILVGCLFVFGGWLMYYIENNRFDDYKQSVVEAQKEQEAKTAKTIEEQQLITKKAGEQYEQNLSSIRNTYQRLRNQSGGNLSSIPSAASGTNASPDNQLPATAELAEQCAETTSQLVFLQNWINDQQQVNK